MIEAERRGHTLFCAACEAPIILCIKCGGWSAHRVYRLVECGPPSGVGSAARRRTHKGMHPWRKGEKTGTRLGMSINVTGSFLEREVREAVSEGSKVAGAGRRARDTEGPNEEEGLAQEAGNSTVEEGRIVWERPSGTFAFPPLVMGYGDYVGEEAAGIEEGEGQGHLRRPTGGEQGEAIAKRRRVSYFKHKDEWERTMLILQSRTRVPSTGKRAAERLKKCGQGSGEGLKSAQEAAARLCPQSSALAFLRTGPLS